MTGPRITRNQLLTPITRWPWQVKFWLCEGIYRKTITVKEVKATHGISEEELTRWYLLYLRQGAAGLQKINRNHRRAA